MSRGCRDVFVLNCVLKMFTVAKLLTVSIYFNGYLWNVGKMILGRGTQPQQKWGQRSSRVI